MEQALRAVGERHDRVLGAGADRPADEEIAPALVDVPITPGLWPAVPTTPATVGMFLGRFGPGTRDVPRTPELSPRPPIAGSMSDSDTPTTPGLVSEMPMIPGVSLDTPKTPAVNSGSTAGDSPAWP